MATITLDAKGVLNVPALNAGDELTVTVDESAGMGALGGGGVAAAWRCVVLGPVRGGGRALLAVSGPLTADARTATLSLLTTQARDLFRPLLPADSVQARVELLCETSGRFVAGVTTVLRNSFLLWSGDAFPAQAFLSGDTFSTLRAALAAHEARRDNPHGVTAAQAGADPAGTASTAVEAHDASADAHADIREALDGVLSTADNAAREAAAARETATNALSGTTAAHQLASDVAAALGDHAGNNSNPHIVNEAQVAAATDAATEPPRVFARLEGGNTFSGTQVVKHKDSACQMAFSANANSLLWTGSGFHDFRIAGGNLRGMSLYFAPTESFQVRDNENTPFSVSRNGASFSVPLTAGWLTLGNGGAIASKDYVDIVAANNSVKLRVINGRVEFHDREGVSNAAVYLGFQNAVGVVAARDVRIVPKGNSLSPTAGNSLGEHLASRDNPHGVTAAQVGAASTGSSNWWSAEQFFYAAAEFRGPVRLAATAHPALVPESVSGPPTGYVTRFGEAPVYLVDVDPVQHDYLCFDAGRMLGESAAFLPRYASGRCRYVLYSASDQEYYVSVSVQAGEDPADVAARAALREGLDGASFSVNVRPGGCAVFDVELCHVKNLDGRDVYAFDVQDAGVFNVR